MFKCLNVYMLKCLKDHKGFGMVEIIVAVALMTMFFLAIYEIILFSNKIIASNLRKIEATHFAQEALEAVRLIRDDGWSANISPLANEADYYLSLVGAEWILTTTTQLALNGVFDRTIIFRQVERDVNGDIVATGGTVDTKTRQVSANVSWKELGVDKSIKLETYITNLLSN